MKVTAAQINFHIGNFEKNSDSIISVLKEARTDGSDLVVFSELALTGYPPHDLLERVDFIENCYHSLKKIAAECNGIAALVGAPSINESTAGKRLRNSAFFLSEGEIADVFHKTLLPTYDIFDEYRYFEPNSTFRLLEYQGEKIAVTICEDLWDDQEFDNKFESSRLYSISPMAELAKLNPDFVINLSASPFSAKRISEKKRVFMKKAADYRVPLLMVNQVGGNTELLFEGGSMFINMNGEISEMMATFKEEVRSFDIKALSSAKGEVVFEPGSNYIPMIHDALVLGIRDYFDKTGLQSAILGLSGGIDSAVTACLAKEALGSKNVRGLVMPSMYSSEHSVTDAVELASNLGIRYDQVSITDAYKSITRSLETLFYEKDVDVTEENIQARIRAIMLMALSNKFGNILLNTSNKSETAVGYSTLYGDLAGGLSVLGDVYKSDVYGLAEYINRTSAVIPENTITKPPSAELKPGQADSDTLPDYSILDNIIYQYIELRKPENEISGDGVTPEMVKKVTRMINQNEYKRFQAPPILRISSKAFGYGRRMPLVARY